MTRFASCCAVIANANIRLLISNRVASGADSSGPRSLISTARRIAWVAYKPSFNSSSPGVVPASGRRSGNTVSNSFAASGGRKIFARFGIGSPSGGCFAAPTMCESGPVIKAGPDDHAGRAP